MVTGVQSKICTPGLFECASFGIKTGDGDVIAGEDMIMEKCIPYNLKSANCWCLFCAIKSLLWGSCIRRLFPATDPG